MKIDVIADLHGNRPELPGGDVLIIAGDWTARDEAHELISFALWVNEQKYKHKILIPGNHDNMIQKYPGILDGLPDFVMTFLCDSGVEINGYKFWGTPWTKTFKGMNPKCKAFTVDTEEELAEKFALVPKDTDVLISHGPPYRVLDANESGEPCGSLSLLETLDNVKPLYMVFGHIHEQGGKDIVYKHIGPNTHCLNVSYVDERYRPKNKPKRIYLPIKGPLKLESKE